MQKKKLHSGMWVFLLCLLVVSCMFSSRQDIESPQKTNQPTETHLLTPISLKTEITNTETPVSTKVNTSSIFDRCKLGLGLREETKDILLEYRGHAGLIMAANSNLAEAYFPLFDGALRVLGAPSLLVLETKALRARDMDLTYEVLGYGLETSASTPEEEWRDIMGATQKAEAIGNKFDKQLLLAPGFNLMSQNEDLYTQMAAKGDIWIFQTQQLQKNPPGPDYRQEVERIVSLIRSGNPEIIVWAQITLPPDRKPNAEEWLAYQELIVDLVDGTYIGVYTWDKFTEIALLHEIEAIFESVCMDNLVE